MINDYALELYIQKLSLREMGAILDVEPQALRKALIRQGLAIKAKDRDTSYAAYIGRVPEPIILEVDYEEVSSGTLSRKLDTTERALVRARDELNHYRRVTRESERKLVLEDKVSRIVEKAVTGIKLPEVTINILERNTELPEYGLVLMLSDLHIGDTAGDDVPDNTFNYEVAQDRLNHLIQEVIDNPQQSNVIVIASLFDFIKGLIHGGAYESEGSLIESINNAVSMYTNLLLTLSKVYTRVEVYSTGSNHERVHEHIVTKDKHLDFGRLIDMLTVQIIKASGISNIAIQTTDTGYNLVNINGVNIMMMHGDTLRTYKPTVTASRSKAQDVCNQMFGKSYTHLLSGHTHEFVACTNQYGGANVVNGSLVGNTNFGVQSGYAAIVPSQVICFVGLDGSMQTIRPIQFG